MKCIDAVGFSEDEFLFIAAQYTGDALKRLGMVSVEKMFKDDNNEIYSGSPR